MWFERLDLILISKNTREFHWGLFVESFQKSLLGLSFCSVISPSWHLWGTRAMCAISFFCFVHLINVILNASFVLWTPSAAYIHKSARPAWRFLTICLFFLYIRQHSKHSQKGRRYPQWITCFSLKYLKIPDKQNDLNTACKMTINSSAIRGAFGCWL